jgi:hypothetical protein
MKPANKPECLPARSGAQSLERRGGAKLVHLHERIHRNACRPTPLLRPCIPKADGRMRQPAIAALEDKIVQGALVEVLAVVNDRDCSGLLVRVQAPAHPAPRAGRVVGGHHAPRCEADRGRRHLELLGRGHPRHPQRSSGDVGAKESPF